jgi:dTMP kinase
MPSSSPTPRGKFIVFEGIDGSGKRTQLELLSAELTKRGIAHERIDFPQYQGFFGRLIADYLNGKFGTLAAVDPHFSALLYAGDRLESKPKLEAALASGNILLADRYIASNLAHQSARVPAEKRDEFMQWLTRLEYEIYGLPKEDAVIYLQVPASRAHHLIEKKGARDYTAKSKDLHEADLAHLSSASDVYASLAKQPHWITINCLGAGQSHNELRVPQEIFRDVYSQLESKLLGSSRHTETQSVSRSSTHNP